MIVHHDSGRVIAAIAVFLLMAAGAVAQQYREDPVDDRASRDSGLATRLLRNPGDYAAERDRFLDYFGKSYFPEMTRTSPEGLGALGKLRSDFFSRYILRTSDPRIQKDLTELAYDRMGRVVREQSPNYHPMVRYNALLVIGLLDEQYAIEGANPRPPKPFPAANEFLTVVVGAPKAPASLVVAALVGLERHSKYKDALPPTATANMSNAILKIIAASEPPPGASSSVHAWIKRQSANVLANLGQVGANNEVFEALVGEVANEKMSLEDRSEVAGLLAKLDYADVKIDGKPAAGAIVGLLDDICRREIKRVKEFEQMQIGGGMLRGRQRVGRRDEDAKYDRRRALSLLQQLQPGLAQIAKIVPEDVQGTIGAVQREVDNVIRIAGDPGKVDLEVAASIKSMEQVVSNAAKSLKAPAATAAAASAENPPS